jgi:hypothetical protein
MGYGEVGGGGSVKWAVDVDDLPAVGGKKRVAASGRDNQNPTYLKVTIEYKDLTKAQTAFTNMKNALAGVGSNDKKVTFQIPFDDDTDHKIKVEW